MGDETVVQPPRLHLSAERVDSNGVYLLDDGETILIYVGHNITPHIASALFNVPSYSSINPNIVSYNSINLFIVNFVDEITSLVGFDNEAKIAFIHLREDIPIGNSSRLEPRHLKLLQLI